MRAWLLILMACLCGCATTAAVVPSRDAAANPVVSRASARPARTTSGGTSGGSTQTSGLPLSRGAKIGLWAGVAVVLASLMHSDGEEGAEAPVP